MPNKQAVSSTNLYWAVLDQAKCEVGELAYMLEDIERQGTYSRTKPTEADVEWLQDVVAHARAARLGIDLMSKAESRVYELIQLARSEAAQ